VPKVARLCKKVKGFPWNECSGTTRGDRQVGGFVDAERDGDGLPWASRVTTEGAVENVSVGQEVRQWMAHARKPEGLPKAAVHASS
jgi:hypothetical protein